MTIPAVVFTSSRIFVEVSAIVFGMLMVMFRAHAVGVINDDQFIRLRHTLKHPLVIRFVVFPWVILSWLSLSIMLLGLLGLLMRI